MGDTYWPGVVIVVVGFAVAKALGFWWALLLALVFF